MRLIHYVISIVILLAGYAHAQNGPHVYTDAELYDLAGYEYFSGELPLGDGRYTTDAPLKGYITLCNAVKAGGGTNKNGPWIHGKTWNIKEKLAVQGKHSWNNSSFTHDIIKKRRVLSGNSLPINHPTGLFPIMPHDPAHAYDQNPNFIKANGFREILPLVPVYSKTPYCIGSDVVGIMLNGVPLYNGFDGKLRDAAAHEIQDDCNGHPQATGQYHYHSLSSCITRIGVKIVIGYALDGFPITGPMVAENRYLTTDDLDECHGITSEIEEDGQKRTTYHYVMTQDFPYSVSCFRGKPTRTGPSSPPANGTTNGDPPPEALAACKGKQLGTACIFTSTQGDKINGTCAAPPNMPPACKP